MFQVQGWRIHLNIYIYTLEEFCHTTCLPLTITYTYLKTHNIVYIYMYMSVYIFIYIYIYINMKQHLKKTSACWCDLFARSKNNHSRSRPFGDDGLQWPTAVVVPGSNLGPSVLAPETWWLRKPQSCWKQRLKAVKDCKLILSHIYLSI